MIPDLFFYFPRKDFERILEALFQCTGVQAQLFSAEGQELLSAGPPHPYCRISENCLRPGEFCAGEHRRASHVAATLGEPYFFCCGAGAYHIIFSLINRDHNYGYVLFGPFLMDETDEELIKKMSAASDIPVDTALELYKASQALPSFSPDKVVSISWLIYFLVNSLISGSRELQQANREKLLQQAKISESIQYYKQERAPWKSFPVETERLIVSAVRNGEIETAKEKTNEYLAELYVQEKYNTDAIKLRLIELCTLLSRAIMDRGADSSVVLTLNEKMVRAITEMNDIFAISHYIFENLEAYTGNLYYESASGNRVVKKATEFIHDHLSERISLSEAAKYAGVSIPYLSRLFHQETGESFSDYLNRVRIDKAKYLLENTDYPMLDIAVACGFSEQSYFSKVFKRSTGLTPRQFQES